MILQSSTSIRPLHDESVARINLAAQVFASDGQDATLIKHLVTATGAPCVTLHCYFPGKGHILARPLGQLTRPLADAAAAGKDRLLLLIRERLVFIDEHGPKRRLLFAELSRAGSFVDVAAGVDVAISSSIWCALRAGHQDGWLVLDDVSAATSMVYGAVPIVGVQHLLVGGNQPLEALAQALIESILAGVGARIACRQKCSSSFDCEAEGWKCRQLESRRSPDLPHCLLNCSLVIPQREPCYIARNGAFVTLFPTACAWLLPASCPAQQRLPSTLPPRS